jgi:hypothetical protein
VNRSTIIIVALFSILGILLLVYFLSGDDEKKQYRWTENYNTTSDQPYGTLFIKELLKEYRPGEEFIFNEKKSLKDLLDSVTTTGPTDYIFIGKTLFLDKEDKEALLRFIHGGNDAFVASSSLPFDLLDQVFINECDRDLYLEEEILTASTLNFYHEALRTKKGYTYSYRGAQKLTPYNWQSITQDVFCDSTKAIVPLGFQQTDRVNFFRISYGDGNLYVHTNPIVFSNYFLSKEDKVTYAEGVFSHLKGKAIIWDEFSKLQFEGNNESRSSPLSYILQHKSLKYAWWMMLACAVLYTFFAAKRKQRVIPVIAPKVNTSLEFVKMISALHFQNGNDTDIARKKMKYFFYFVRAKYGIHAQPFTELHMKRLAEKSKIELKDIQIIFNEFHQIERNMYGTPTQDRLVTLYNAIDQFYKHCK